MHAENDKEILNRAGIADVDQLVHAAAEFLRAYPWYQDIPVNALNDQEKAFLREGGAQGVDTDQPSGAHSDNLAIVAAEYAQMVATALTQRETAELLGVSTSRVRQRIDRGSLYAIESSVGRVCPRFQFYRDPRFQRRRETTVPGIEPVLAAIHREAHPVAVQKFFLTPTVDLSSEEAAKPLSPRDWLISGHPPESVVLLAQEL